MISKYVGIIILGVFIVAGTGAYIYFKIKWGVADRAEQHKRAKEIGEEHKLKEKNQH